MSKETCDMSIMEDQRIDPFSKRGKSKLAKSNCSIVNIQENGFTMFFLGDSFSKNVLQAKGYFSTKSAYDGSEGKWKSVFTKVKPFKTEKIVLTDGKGPNQNGLVLTPEKGSMISRTLGHITFQI